MTKFDGETPRAMPMGEKVTYKRSGKGGPTKRDCGCVMAGAFFWGESLD